MSAAANPEFDLAQLKEAPHVWLLPVPELAEPKWVAEHEPILSDDERERWQRYRRPKDRDLFLRTHVLVRETLSRYGDCPPEEWRFEANEYGRPEIVGGPTGLRFNLSHTEGMIAVLIHDAADAGVDVERIGRVDDLVSVSKTAFSESEQAGLMMLDEGERELRFYSLWTLKEAYIKARGMGLAIPLDSFSFALETRGDLGGLANVGDAGAIGFSGSDDVSSEWVFSAEMCSPNHVLSTARRAGSSPAGGTAGRPVVRRLSGGSASEVHLL